MTNIFLSRPTWISPEFKSGLASFLQFLESHDLVPRTIGATDFATKTPLDDVIALLGECKGAVILGFPQIRVEAGFLKDKSIPTETKSTLLLPTEWNHIEAGLAYAMKKPLLVIHHEGVSRGVFDRGAISSFIYSVDMTNAAWPMLPQIAGALKKWKKDVLLIEDVEVPSESDDELSEEASSLLSEIEACDKSATKGLSIMRASGSTGAYVPYIWDNMLHGALEPIWGDISPVLSSIDELVTAGYLRFHYAAGSLEQYRRTRKRKP
jgi:hypothetical protein